MSVIRPNKTGNRWNKLALPFYGSVALGNATQWRVNLSEHYGELVVGVEGHGLI